MHRRGTLRIRLEVILGVTAGLVSVVTLLWPDWIEAVTGASPDGGDGTLEWVVVGACALVSGALLVLARTELRHARAAAASL